jgi:hypothetical protein
VKTFSKNLTEKHVIRSRYTDTARAEHNKAGNVSIT